MHSAPSVQDGILDTGDSTRIHSSPCSRGVSTPVRTANHSYPSRYSIVGTRNAMEKVTVGEGLAAARMGHDGICQGPGARAQCRGGALKPGTLGKQARENQVSTEAQGLSRHDRGTPAPSPQQPDSPCRRQRQTPHMPPWERRAPSCLPVAGRQGQHQSLQNQAQGPCPPGAHRLRVVTPAPHGQARLPSVPQATIQQVLTVGPALAWTHHCHNPGPPVSLRPVKIVTNEPQWR